LEGCYISENINLRDCWPEIDSFTCKITAPEDIGYKMFAQKTKPITWLTLDEDEVGGTIDVAKGTNAATTNDYIYVGTEVMKVGTVGAESFAVTRTQWDTISQGHYKSQKNIEEFNPFLYMAYDDSAGVYYPPPAIENRRVWLIQYREGETPDTDTPLDAGFTDRWVFRGVIAQAPMLAPDGVSWIMTIAPITTLFEQEFAPNRGDGWGITGIYHSDDNAATVVEYDTLDGDHSDKKFYKFVGYWETDEEFAEEITNYMDDKGTNVDDQHWAMEPDGKITNTIDTDAVSAPVYSSFYISSMEGCIDFDDAWNFESAGKTRIVGYTSLTTSTQYWRESNIKASKVFYSDDIANASIMGFPRGYLGMVPMDWRKWANGGTIAGANPEDNLNDTVGNNPSNRVYIESSIEPFLTTDDRLRIETPGCGPIVVGVSTINNTSGVYYVHLDDPFLSQMAPSGGGLLSQWIALVNRGVSTFANAVPVVLGGSSIWPYPLDGSTKIQVIKVYTSDSNLADFVDEVTDESIYANNGSVPFITSYDIDDTMDSTISDQKSGIPFLEARNYAFGEKVSFRDVIIEECKLYGVFLRSGSDGKITCSKLKMPSSTETHTTINSDNIITQYASTGEWPSWTPDQEGIVSLVEFKYGYDHVTKGYESESTVMDDLSITLYKNRGRSAIEIKPYSTTSKPADVDSEDLERIANRLLGFFAQSYDIIEIPVSMDLMTTVFCGSYVSVTSSHIPDTSDGTKGITAKPGLVVGRQWPLDPSESVGRLRVRIERGETEGGYAPACYVSSATNVSGYTYDLTVTANKYAPTGENDNSYFSAGQQIMVIERNDSVPDAYYGEVATVPNSTTVRVDILSTAGPSSLPGIWHLTYSDFSNVASLAGYVALSAQQNYVYVAEADGDLYALADKAQGDRFK
jgi:hypothetical protein